MVHTPTLLLINILVTGTLAFCLGIVSTRERRDGLVWWAAALGVHTAAYTLYALRGLVPDWASVLLANTLLAAFFVLVLEGLYEFHRQRAPRLRLWAAVLALLFLLAAFPDSIQARAILVTLLFSLLCAGTLVLLLRYRAQTVGRGQYFVMAAYVLLLLMLLARAAAVLSGALQLRSITDSNALQAGTFVMATISLMLVSLGLILMTKEQTDERNRVLALQDELTGLHNRRFILEVLAQQLALARRHRRPLALLILDVDHFKRVNDNHGHLAGDQVLREMAACIRSRLRAQDIAGRWGGEEFIVLLPDTGTAGAVVLAEALRTGTQQHRFAVGDGVPLQLTVSIGLHAEDEPGGRGRDDWLNAADLALYEAKRLGRNRIEQA